MTTKPAGKTPIPGAIGANDLYTIDELRRRLGLSSWSVRRARRRGLRTFKIARRRYVLGKDFIAYLEGAGS